MLKNYKVNLPEHRVGYWRIERFEVGELEARMDAYRSGYRAVSPGTYTRLMRGSTVVMSDTPAEVYDHLGFIRKAQGSVLINGLGLGMCLKAVLAKPEVNDVTVVEVDPDVIELVSGYYKDDRLSIINASAFDYKPPVGKKYGAVWHDIWDYITSDNLPEMTKLHRKYGNRADWQGSWCKGECKRMRR